jgi:uncharacterized protein
MLVVCDSSPIIALSRINKLTILNSLYKKILIPLAVKEEVLCDPFKRINLNKVSWIEVRSLKHPLSAKILSANLGKGESEALGLTLELNANLLIIDDLAARNMADFLEITYTGTLGILLKAKKRNLSLL